MTNENSSSEIDLWQLMLDLFSFLKRRKWIVILFLSVGVILGVFNVKNNMLTYKPFYKKEFVLQSSVASNEIIYDIINNIPGDIYVSKTDTNQIPSAATTPVYKSIKGKLEANSQGASRLKVTLEVYEKENIDSVINKLETYLNSIEYLRSRYELMKKQNLQLLSVINKRLSEADNPKEHNDQVLTSNSLSYVELLEKKQNIEKELSQNKIASFIDINSPSIFVNNKNKAAMAILGYGFLGIFIGIAAGYILDLILKVKRS